MIMMTVIMTQGLQQAMVENDNAKGNAILTKQLPREVRLLNRREGETRTTKGGVRHQVLLDILSSSPVSSG